VSFSPNYYGCCEPLRRKIHVATNTPRLRKISMSPWVDIDGAVQAVGDRFVFSRKPSPAIFAEDGRDPQRARGCVVEVILKDISTVRYQPKHLWEWARIAAEVTEESA
jgi:hypothetical protein